MNPVIRQMLQRYTPRSFQEHEQALREILQELALVGLWRAKFFEHAAFYGGTALRVFYQLDRFSEDLDFTLLTPKNSWSWEPFGEVVKRELFAFGFDSVFMEKEKKTETAVKSAFLKTTTLQEMLKVGVHADFLKGIHPEMMIRIKIEVDTRPPISYACEQKFLAEPLPVSIKCVNEESLFAAKMQAAFFRTWKNRVKGRDWYDIVWFIRRKIPFNLEIFSALMAVPRLSKSDFLEIAKERIAMLDVDLAIEDILHFVKDQESIRQSWSKDFFKYWMERIPFKE